MKKIEAVQGEIWVVIAAYNEEKVIGAVIDGLSAYPYKIVVVDDGSTDKTGDIVREKKAYCINHPVNLGQGAAIQTGLDFAVTMGAKYIVTFDADGQHSPNAVADLVSALLSSGADIACGSRFLGSVKNLPRSRRTILKLATMFTFWTTGIRMTDAHNGLRAFTAASAKKIRISQNRMAHASEIIEQISSLNLAFIEVPVVIEYTPYSLSKGQKLSGAITILIDLIVKRMYK